nr:hypothetical protein [Tanacetum cinerariifolium]
GTSSFDAAPVGVFGSALGCVGLLFISIEVRRWGDGGDEGVSGVAKVVMVCVDVGDGGFGDDGVGLMMVVTWLLSWLETWPKHTGAALVLGRREVCV